MVFTVHFLREIKLLWLWPYSDTNAWDLKIIVPRANFEVFKKLHKYHDALEQYVTAKLCYRFIFQI